MPGPAPPRLRVGSGVRLMVGPPRCVTMARMDKSTMSTTAFPRRTPRHPRHPGADHRRGRGGPGAPPGVPVLWVRASFVLAHHARRPRRLPVRRALDGAAGRRGLRAGRPGHRGRDPRRSAPRPDPATDRRRTRGARSRRSASVRCCSLDAVFGQGALFWAALLGRRSASRCCGARPTRPSASAGSTAPAGSTRSGSCSATAAGRRTPGSLAGVPLIVGALVLLSRARRRLLRAGRRRGAGVAPGRRSASASSSAPGSTGSPPT